MDTVSIVEWFNRSLISLDTHFVEFSNVLSRSSKTDVFLPESVLDFTGGTQGWTYQIFQPSRSTIVDGPVDQITHSFLVDLLDSFWFTVADAVKDLQYLDTGLSSVGRLPVSDGQSAGEIGDTLTVSELGGYLLEKGLSSCYRQGRLNFMHENGDINLGGNLFTSDSYADYA